MPTSGVIAMMVADISHGYIAKKLKILDIIFGYGFPLIQQCIFMQYEGVIGEHLF